MLQIVNNGSNGHRLLTAILLRLTILLVVLGGIIFVFAGRIDLPFAWAFMGLFALSTPVMLRVIDPGLMRERLNPAPGGTDRHIRAMIFPFILLHLAIAGLDLRFGWSPPGVVAQVGGLIGFVLSMTLSIWSVSVNRFFSPVVRIQVERGHHLIQDGPYRRIRHPGYLAAIGMMLCSGLVLGSWWSVIPNLGGAAVIVRRLLIEDRFLHENLPGYADYARRVKARIIPGIW